MTQLEAELLAALKAAHAWLAGMSFTPACAAEAEKLIERIAAAIASATPGDRT